MALRELTRSSPRSLLDISQAAVDFEVVNTLANAVPLLHTLDVSLNDLTGGDWLSSLSRMVGLRCVPLATRAQPGGRRAAVSHPSPVPHAGGGGGWARKGLLVPFGDGEGSRRA